MSFGATNDSLVSDALSGLGKSSPSAIKYNKCGGKKRKSRKNRRSRKSRKSRRSRKSRKSRRKQKGGCGCGKMIGGKRRKSRRSRRRRTRKQRGGYSQYGNNVANTLNMVGMSASIANGKSGSMHFVITGSTGNNTMIIRPNHILYFSGQNYW